MAFSELELARVHRTMAAYIARRRPHPEIREELDIGYSVEGQSVIIHEDRRLYDGSRILGVRRPTTISFGVHEEPERYIFTP